MLTLNDGRSELWQWDTGRTLSVDADCSQVHFSNKVFGRSIDVDVADGVAIIPDILLQTDNDLNVWAFVGAAENGYTKISKTFKVNRRNKPSDYVFTPPEQTTLAELSGRLDKIEEYQDPDAIKNAVDDYLKQNPVEVPVKSVNGKTGAVKLTAEDVGAIAAETDPTVPEWAKAATKPSYTAEEVGARSADWMPTAAEVGALPTTYTPPDQTAEQVGADPSGTAASAVSQHNTDATSHNDLRLALKGLSDRINVVLDSDDTTLDQMSEVVAYIKSNKSMIDAITTSKVNVSDIVNNLTTNISNKPLSAAQGVALKELIDALSNSMTAYRTAAAQDVIDSGKVDKVTGKGLSSNDYTATAKAKVDAIPANPKYTDTVYDDTALKERVATIEGKESAWDAKSDFSGSYNDLTDKPTIPTEVTPLIGTTAELTPSQVQDAMLMGRPVAVQYTDSTYGVLKFTNFNIASSSGLLVSVSIINTGGFWVVYTLNGNTSTQQWNSGFTQMATTSQVNSVDVKVLDVSTRVSTLENAGYLTLATLPKYGGENT